MTSAEQRRIESETGLRRGRNPPVGWRPAARVDYSEGASGACRRCRIGAGGFPAGRPCGRPARRRRIGWSQRRRPTLADRAVRLGAGSDPPMVVCCHCQRAVSRGAEPGVVRCSIMLNPRGPSCPGVCAGTSMVRAMRRSVSARQPFCSERPSGADSILPRQLYWAMLIIRNLLTRETYSRRKYFLY